MICEIDIYLFPHDEFCCPVLLLTATADIYNSEGMVSVLIRTKFVRTVCAVIWEIL